MLKCAHVFCGNKELISVPFVLGLARGTESAVAARPHVCQLVALSHENEGGCSFGPGVCAALHFCASFDMHLWKRDQGEKFTQRCKSFDRIPHTLGRAEHNADADFVCLLLWLLFFSQHHSFCRSRQKEQSRYGLCREKDEKEKKDWVSSL